MSLANEIEQLEQKRDSINGELTELEKFKSFNFDDLVKRNRANLDIFWLKDESMEDSENLPPPDVIAKEIAENLEAALNQFTSIYQELETKG